MRSVEELFEEFVAAGGSGLWQPEAARRMDRAAFMAGAAAMGAQMAKGAIKLKVRDVVECGQ